MLPDSLFGAGSVTSMRLPSYSKIINSNNVLGNGSKLLTHVRNILFAVFCLGMTFFSASASAGESVQARKIVGLGCHNFNGICFVTLDGSAFASTLGCSVGTINEFRFDNGDTAIGKRTYAALLAASIAGKAVTVYLDGCTSQGYPNLSYYYVAS